MPSSPSNPMHNSGFSTQIQKNNTSQAKTPAASGNPGDIEAIEFASTNAALQTAIDYITETRSDFATVKQDGPWIDTLLTAIDTAKKKVRDLEITHFDNLVEWTDEDGVTHQIMHRLQDEAGFDSLKQVYTDAEAQFATYFDKHLNILKDHPELLDV